jgi:hypothetical protein
LKVLVISNLLDENDKIEKGMDEYSFLEKKKHKHKSEVEHEETDADKLMFAESKNLVFFLDLLVKLKAYYKLWKDYSSDKTDSKFKNLKLQFEVIKNFYLNKHSFFKVKKAKTPEFDFMDDIKAMKKGEKVHRKTYNVEASPLQEEL